jgi:N-hydroxyarylamine O-acetyltransferase
VTARTHRLLVVRIDGREWLADAGFGGQMPTAVLDLHSEATQPTTHEPFRLRFGQGDAARTLESLVAGEWKPLYRFDLQPQWPIDFEAANFQLSQDPASHFTQGLVASRVVDAGRHVLRGRELAYHALGGGTTRRELAIDALLPALEEVFGIHLDAALVQSLRQRLES